ncbi:hypothetical protein ACN28S_36445 [Cystobacter fuscus]
MTRGLSATSSSLLTTVAPTSTSVMRTRSWVMLQLATASTAGLLGAGACGADGASPPWAAGVGVSPAQAMGPSQLHARTNEPMSLFFMDTVRERVVAGASITSSPRTR